MSSLYSIGLAAAQRRAGGAVVGFDLVTPDGVMRRISALDAAWGGLAAHPGTAPVLVHNEAAAWATFRDGVKGDWLSKWFASGTLNELDGWQRRYDAAYTAAGKPLEVPTPEAVAPPAPVDAGTQSFLGAAKWASAAVIAVIAIAGAAYVATHLPAKTAA